MLLLKVRWAIETWEECHKILGVCLGISQSMESYHRLCSIIGVVLKNIITVYACLWTSVSAALFMVLAHCTVSY